MPKALKYGAVLIGVYLIVRNYTGSGKVISAATTGAATVTKALQGR